MNKKSLIKIIISIFSMCFLIYSFIVLFDYIFKQIYHLKNLKSYLAWGDNITYEELYNEQIVLFIKGLINNIINLLSSILLFLVINFKDLKFLTESIIEKFVSWRKDTEEERKENKQAKLQREISEKQAELEKMKNDTKTE